ncbi:MAG: RagB/SusD family nutrient uptake outer membrane protein [Tannerella sp.]|nr:RagB/SusD family nutrient uptake outer membrane protein [Tannerella sp.]
MKQIKLNGLFVWGIMLLTLASCDYLDIVPENVYTVDDMFADRYAAEKSLASCYWAIPRTGGNWNTNPGILGSLESILNKELREQAGMRIGLSEDNATSPVMNYWNSTDDGTRSVYAGIRDCNTFLDNIENVKDLPRREKDRMIAEAKLLKAYMHFQLIYFYGPICPLRTSPPVDESTQGVRAYREKIDDCFQYVLDLVNEVIESNALPSVITNQATEVGRFTQAAAWFIKAKVLVYWASPLFNGNTDYNNFLDHNDEPFFNQQYNSDRWTQAAEACKQAVAYCQENERFRLYDAADYIQLKPLSPEYLRIEVLRSAVTATFSVETIWSGTAHSLVLSQSSGGPQSECMPRLETSTSSTMPTPGRWSIPLQSVEWFYSSNGVPVNEDKEWLNGEDKKYENRFKVRVSDEAHQRQVQLGEQSASMNFDREPRFYSSLGFDRGKWYGSSYNNTPDNELDCLYPKARYREYSALGTGSNYNATGYWPKKLIQIRSFYVDPNTFYSFAMAWPEMRYADLLLLAAEALNESKTQPDNEVYQYIDQVRRRAGLEGVTDSWEKYAENASKPATKSGMRAIIQQERKIELAFEGQYHWDCRRWKTAPAELNRLVQGWTVTESDVNAYYQVSTVYTQKFSLRDYFMPVPESDMINNPQLIQNPGW